jgi:HSP20 family protein
MRSAASALFDAERTLDEMSRQFRSYPALRISTETGFSPRVSAVENETGYTITAELPGVESEDLEVIVEDGVLTIKGQRRLPGEPEAEQAADASKSEAEDVRGRFQRRYRFNGEIDEAEVKARYRNGLLTVSVPKRRQPEPEVRTIPVEVA